MSDPFQRRIYLLSPKRLSPETIAVAFAKTSRSPLSFQEIADELSDEQSAEFHEKWVVGYGHGSVAEHAVLHIALENVSRLAIECIESNRLASYTEKSTRYQQWQPGGYHTPQEYRGGSKEELYRKTCDALFEAYRQSLEPARQVVREQHPPKKGESDDAWDRRIRSKYVDSCRFLLPSAAFANVGMTANARVLENAIRKMLSHPLAEVREIGAAIKSVAQEEVPTLVKYAGAVPYRMETERELTQLAATWDSSPVGEAVEMTAYEPEGELRVLAAALYEHANSSFETTLAAVKNISANERQALAESILGRLDKFDVPLRVLEHAAYTFDIILDQGAYFELKRHRMMTQSPQRLTPDLGYAIPRLIVDAGYEAAYRQNMDSAAAAYRKLAEENLHAASYVIPNGFNRRVLCTLNLREVFHLCELRSRPNAHFSIRRIALLVAEKVRQVHPLLAGFLRLPQDVGWREIESEHFSKA
jgi:thymidylate synthase ThyX